MVIGKIMAMIARENSFNSPRDSKFRSALLTLYYDIIVPVPVLLQLINFFWTKQGIAILLLYIAMSLMARSWVQVLSYFHNKSMVILLCIYDSRYTQPSMVKAYISNAVHFKKWIVINGNYTMYSKLTILIYKFDNINVNKIAVFLSKSKQRYLWLLTAKIYDVCG